MHRGAEGRAGLQALEEVLDLQAVGGGVALQEEGFRLVGPDAAGVPLAHFARGVVAGLQHAVGPQHLEALVVAVGGAAGGVDLAQAALPGADRHRGRVEVAGLADGRIGQHRAGGAQPRGLVAVATENPAEHVEVVDQHVAEDAARALDVFDRRRTGVAAGDDQHLGVADLAGVDAAAHLVEGRVEAALEADHAGDTGGAHLLAALDRTRHRQVDRLLAEDVLAGGGRAGDQVGVGAGGRADDDRIDRGIEQRVVHRGDLRAELLRELRGAVAERVADVLEADAGQTSEVAGVDAADAAGAEDGDVLHGWISGGGTGRNGVGQDGSPWLMARDRVRCG